MSIVMQINPFEFFVDASGTPLDGGYIWVGEPNKYPKTFPASAYYDEDLLTPAVMPLRTSNGYISRNGSPAFLFIGGNYSILVEDKNNQQVFYVPDFLMSGSGSAISAGDLANAIDPSKGAALVGYSGRTVRDALRDRVNVADYMFDSSGVARTQTQAAQAAADDALSTGKALYFPGGNPWILSASIIGVGKPIQLVGDGPASTKIIFTGATGGFDFTLNSQALNTPPQKASVSGMTIESQNTIPSAAVSFTWTTYQANAQGSFWASDLNITRSGTGTGSFASGIKLNKCFVGFIDRCVMLGDDARVSNYAIHLIDSVGIRISDCDMNRYKEGVHIEKISAIQNEGVLIQNCFIYDVYAGVFAANQCIHINIVNSHININGASASACVILTTASQCTITGCLLYAGGSVGDPATQDCIRLALSCNGNRITGNQLNGLSIARARYGVITTGVSSFNAIEGNNINSFPEGISISGAGDTGNRISNNDFFGCTINITDIGVNTYKSENTSSGDPVSSVRWGAAAGSFGAGEISTNASWGAYIRGRSGTAADIGLIDAAGVHCASIKSGVFAVHTYVKASLPTAILINGGTGIIGVSDDVSGFTLAFSDGTNWRRVADRAIIS